MAIFLACPKLDMLYCNGLLVIYAFVNAKSLPLAHLLQVLDIAVKTSLQTQMLHGTQDVVKVQAGMDRGFAQAKTLNA